MSRRPRPCGTRGREPECGWAADGLHGADLHRARLRAQEDFLVVRHVERVAAVAGRVVLGDVELGEVVVGKLDLRAVKDLEAHGDEDILGLVERLVHRVPVAQLHGRAGDGHVDGLGLEPGLERLLLELRADRLNLFLDGRADVVCDLTHDRALFRRQLAHHLQNARQLALLAEEPHAQRVQLTGVLDAVQRAERFLPDLFQLFFHKRMLLFVIIQKNKALRPDRGRKTRLPRYHPLFAENLRCFWPGNGGHAGAS